MKAKKTIVSSLKVLLLLIIGSITLCLLPSCGSKKQDVTPPPTKAQLMSNHKWKIGSVTYDHQDGGSTSAPQTLSTEDEKLVYNFKSDGTFSDGPNSDGSYTSGNWDFPSSTTVEFIVKDSSGNTTDDENYTLNTLTASSLSISESLNFSANGHTYTGLTINYVPQ